MSIPADDPPLFATMHTMRAMRRLKPDPVPLALVDQVLEAATMAPNGGNVQPWRFLVVVDRELRRQMGELYRSAWDDYFQPTRDAVAAARRPPTGIAKRSIESAEILGAHFGEAPVHVLVLNKPAMPPERYPAGHAGIYAAVYPAVENLLLACRGLGLGATLTTLHRERQDEVRALLGFPDDLEICACIPIGWPQDRFGPVKRKPIEEVAFRDRWGAPWERSGPG